MSIMNQVTERFGNVNTKGLLQSVNFWTLFLPIALFTFYNVIWATERYESRSQLTVQSSSEAAVADPMLMVMGLSGGANTVQDAELVKAYVASNDMLELLTEGVDLRSIYSDSSVDFFSRLGVDSSVEEYFDHYLNHVSVDIDTLSGVITITSQAFDPSSAQLINAAIVARAEEYINSISMGLGQSKLTFLTLESERTLRELKVEQRKLLNFQSENGLLDPLAEGAALQQITYGLESQIASVESQLLNAKQTMTASAPEVLVLESQLVALQGQLTRERSRLSNLETRSIDEAATSGVPDKSVSEVLTEYAELKLSYEFALQAYSATQMSLSAATVETYRQAKHLVTLERPTMPEASKYPDVFYNVLLLTVVLLMLHAIIRIVVATVKELG